MLLLRYWLHRIDHAVRNYFIALAEADTPESWGECPVPIEEKPAQKKQI